MKRSASSQNVLANPAVQIGLVAALAFVGVAAPILGGQVAPPQAVSGRVAAIAVDPTDLTHWLIGAAQGGVWESLNAGSTWAPLTDAQASLVSGWHRAR